MIKIVHCGIEFHCETTDEAVEIAAKLSGGKVPEGLKKRGQPEAIGGGSRWTTSRFQTFIGQLHDQQRKFLRQILSNPDGLTDAVLRQALSLSSNKAFGPIITGISRKAKKAGVSLQDVVSSEKVTLSSGEKVLEYKANPVFVTVSREGGGIK